MEIVCVLGSPRTKGSSTAIAKRFCDTAEKLGANIRYFHLNDLNFKGCQGCLACKSTSDRCVFNDDLTQVLEAIMDTDILVVTSPVYILGVTGQLKCFIDRTYSFLGPEYITHPQSARRLSPGKKMVFIMTQGAPAGGMFGDIVSQIRSIFTFCGFSEINIIRAGGMSPMGFPKIPEDIMELAATTVKEMMCSN